MPTSPHASCRRFATSTRGNVGLRAASARAIVPAMNAGPKRLVPNILRRSSPSVVDS